MKINPESEVLVEVQTYLLSGPNKYNAGRQFHDRFKNLPEDIQLEITENTRTVKVLQVKDLKEVDESEVEEAVQEATVPKIKKIKKVKKVKKVQVSE